MRSRWRIPRAVTRDSPRQRHIAQVAELAPRVRHGLQMVAYRFAGELRRLVLVDLVVAPSQAAQEGGHGRGVALATERVSVAVVSRAPTDGGMILESRAGTTHPSGGPKKRVQCRMWTVLGNCAQGATCHFAHGAQEERRAPELAMPGTKEADEAFRSPSREYFDWPAPYEVAYGEEEEKALVEARSSPGGWRKVETGGVQYWYNELTGLSQWEDPTAAIEEKPAEASTEAPRNDDFEALVKAAEGDTICEPIGDGVLLRIIVKPGQTEDNVLDVTPSCVKVSLRAPIEDGWCNQALLAFCRRALHVPQRERNAVKITDGDESLDKIVYIPALSPKDVIKRLHKRRDFEVDTNDVEKWIRHTEKKQKEEERRMKRRKWA